MSLHALLPSFGVRFQGPICRARRPDAIERARRRGLSSTTQESYSDRLKFPPIRLLFSIRRTPAPPFPVPRGAATPRASRSLWSITPPSLVAFYAASSFRASKRFPSGLRSSSHSAAVRGRRHARRRGPLAYLTQPRPSRARWQLCPETCRDEVWRLDREASVPLARRKFRLKPPGASVHPICPRRVDRHLVKRGTGMTATAVTTPKKTLTTPYQAKVGVGASKQKLPPVRAA